MRDFLCSGNPQLAEYVLNWVAHACTGRKMRTMLYMRSGQGTGKSIYATFLTNVIGKALSLVSSSADTVIGGFNGQLLGKTLMVLEEAAALSHGQWQALSGRLKHLITSDTLEICEKYKTPFEVRNAVSVMVLTNANAIKLESDDRRTVSLDISAARVNDQAYFDRLGEATETDEVQAAYYSWCVEHAAHNADFRENAVPRTQAKLDNTVDNLHHAYKHIKAAYLARGQGVDASFADFHASCNATREREITKPALSKLLAAVGITTKNKKVAGKQTKWLCIGFAPLRAEYAKRGWIHDTDEMIDPRRSDGGAGSGASRATDGQRSRGAGGALGVARWAGPLETMST